MSDVNTAENGLIQIEIGQELSAMAALTDSGDHQYLTSTDRIWSIRSGYTPVVRPDGLVTGGEVNIDDAGADDKVDVSALTCYLAGVLTSVNAGELSLTRGTAAGTKYRKASITVSSAGALTVVNTADGAAAFNDTRGADGGPPYIPVGSIEIAQVWMDSEVAAPIEADEIKSIIGQHVERYDYPNFSINTIKIDSNTLGGTVTFDAALPQSHTGDLIKGVYAEYYTPVFGDIQNAENYVPPETTHSVSSKQVYGGILGSRSKSLSQGSFTAYMSSGISDTVITLKNEVLTFKFYPDRNDSRHVLCQGALGILRKFPASDLIGADCTVSSLSPAVDMDS